jgi:aminoglycoside 2''-phosphotransferase
MNSLEQYAVRIREIAPEIDARSMRLNEDGLINDVVIVNEEFVFRFPKHEYSFKHFENEIKILRLLEGRLTLPIPRPFYVGRDCMAYRMIPGETLRPDLLLRMPEDDRQGVADQLAQFFKELHGFPLVEFADSEIPAADSLRKYEGWVNAYERIREKVFPLLIPYLRDSLTKHFETHLAERENFEYELRLVNTDIPPYHIMFDRERRRVNGIIDFGCAGLGDPAHDLSVVMYNYGESFLRKFYKVYPEAESYLKRARFYTRAVEARWVLRGIESGNPFWFAVHIGGAKGF